MNVGALLAGPVIDILNISVPSGGIRIGYRNWSGNRLVLMSSAISCVVSFLVSVLLLRDAKVEGASTVIENTENNVKQSQRPGDESSKTLYRWFPCWGNCLSLIQSATLWRYATVTLVLINLQAIFLYMDSILPTYLIRLHGTHISKGMLFSINPLIIVSLTPVVAAVTSKYNHFRVIKYGGFITGVAPFFLAISSSVGAAAAMIAVISLGEAVWSPRLYDYVMSIAPEVHIMHIYHLMFSLEVMAYFD